MTSDDKKKLAISIFMVFALMFISYWRFLNQETPELSFSVSENSGDQIPSVEELFSLEYMEEAMPSEEDIFFEDEDEKRKYVRKEINGKITFDIPSSWEEMEAEKIENLSEQIEAVFLARSRYGFHGATLPVVKIDAENASDAIEKLKDVSEEKGGVEVEVLEKEEKEEKYSLKILYTTKEGQRSLSKNKLFSVGGEYYLFSVIALEEGFENISSQVDHILASIQIKE